MSLPSRWINTVSGFALGLCLWATPSLAATDDPPATDAPTPQKSEKGRDERRAGMFDPAALRARLVRRLEELKRDEARLSEALSRIDKGEAPGEIARTIRAEVRNDRDEKRNDQSTNSRPGPRPRPAADEPFDRDRVLAAMKEHLPALSERFETWRQHDPEGAERVLSRFWPHIGEAIALKERDPALFDLKRTELESRFGMMESARAYTRAQMDRTTEGREARVTAARAKLREAIGEQFDARMALQAREIEGLTKRLAELLANHERQTGRRDQAIDEQTARVTDPQGGTEGPKRRPKDDRRPGASDDPRERTDGHAPANPP